MSFTQGLSRRDHISYHSILKRTVVTYGSPDQFLQQTIQNIQSYKAWWDGKEDGNMHFWLIFQSIFSSQQNNEKKSETWISEFWNSELSEIWKFQLHISFMAIKLSNCFPNVFWYAKIRVVPFYICDECLKYWHFWPWSPK